MLLAQTLTREIAWKQESIRLFGRERAMPRLTAWYGDPDATYTYSGLRNEPAPWTADLLDLRCRVEDAAGARFNGVLLNCYRSGSDSMGWHADDEGELGPQPTIAAVSLGAVRRFRLRHRTDPSRTVEQALEPGSLLVMSGRSQECWLHAVPKQSSVREPRINLTFRLVQRPDRWP